MTVGTELRQARERAGLSAAQISERTKIQLYRIEALETAEFAKLPQGIYLDGIVRAYASELGLAHETLVERVRAERGTLPGDWPAPFAAQIDLHPKAHDRHEAPAPHGIDILDDFQGGDPLDSFTTEGIAPVAPREQPKRKTPRSVQSLDMPVPQTRRRSGLGLALLGALAAAVVGMFVAQSRPQVERDAPAMAAESSRSTKPADSAIGTSGRRRGGQPTDVPTPFTENVITPERPSATKAAPSGTARGGTVDTAPTPPAPPPSSSPAADNSAPTPPVANVTGAWVLATRVESSSLARFEGLQLGYEMRLRQDGDRVTGAGRKVTENGTDVGKRAQTPLTIDGRIDGDRLVLSFVERGTRRPTRGTFDLLMDDTGTLRGSFSSTAARSSGRVEAHRVSTE